MTDAKSVERGHSRCENIVCTYVRAYVPRFAIEKKKAQIA